MNVPLPPPSTDNLPALETPSWLLMGPSGTGKTYAITTLLKAGLEVFVLVTEADALSVLLDQVKAQNLPLAKLHWHVVAAAKSGLPALIDMAKKVKMLDFESITRLSGGIGKDKQDQFIEVLTTINNFKCDRTGQTYGDVTTWGSDRIFVIDSLSGINHMVWKLVVGLRPTAAPGEWNIAQNTIFDLMSELTSGCKCFFLVIAHIEREVDEVTGGTKIMVATVGRKLAPKLAPIFSEVVLTKRVGDKFTWSTTSLQADLKARTLPFSDDILPTFEPLVAAYRSREAFLAAAGAARLPTATPPVKTSPNP